MHGNTIKVFQGKPVIGTWDLSLFVQLQHRLLKITVNRFHKQMISLSGSAEVKTKGKCPVYRRNKQVGAPIYEYFLEANQIKLLLALLPPRGKCLMAKMFLIEKTHLPEVQFLKELEELLG